jgi:hypothetical protein
LVAELDQKVKQVQRFYRWVLIVSVNE